MMSAAKKFTTRAALAPVILGALVMVLAGITQSHARGIRVDTEANGGSNWGCLSVSPSDIWVTMTAGSPSAAATLEPGLSTDATSLCTPSFSELDDFGGANLGPFTITKDSSYIYTWGNGIQVADYTLDPTASSNQNGNDNLLGNANTTNYAGDSEIQFNFLGADGTTCLFNSTTPQAYIPEFVIGGTTYGETHSVCDPSATSDMLFDGTTLVGYIDLSGNVHLAGSNQTGLAPGWKVISTSVPEPGMLTLMALGLAGTALARRKRKTR